MKKLLVGFLALGSISCFASDTLCTAKIYKDGKVFSTVSHKVEQNTLSFSGQYSMGLEASSIWVQFSLDTIHEDSYILDVENRSIFDDKYQLKLSTLNTAEELVIDQNHTLVFECK